MSSPNAHLLSQSRRTTIFRWPTRKRPQTRISCNRYPSTRRRKLPWVRLGGKNRHVRRGFFIVRVFRRLRLRWLRLHYSYMLKKLKAFYSSVVKDFIEAGAAMDAVHKRTILDAYFTVPIMPMSVAAMPSHMDRHALT